MDFKLWLTEGIVIQTNRGEAQLVSAEDTVPNFKEFNYQDDKSYSTWNVIPRKGNLVGWANVGSRSNYVVITKTQTMESGADIAFTENLIKLLRASNFKFVPWKEGESHFVDLINKETGKDLRTEPTDFQTSPNPREKASHMAKVTNTFSVSKESGAWTVVIEAYDAPSVVRSVINIMKKAIQPLIDHDIIEFYEVSNRSGGREEIVYSKSGKETHDDYHSSFTKYLEQMLFMAEVSADKYPNTNNYIKRDVARWKIPNLQPKNHRIPVRDLYKKVYAHNANNCVLHLFVYASEKQDGKIFDLLERVLTEKGDPNRNTAGWLAHQALILLDVNMGVSSEHMEPLPSEFWKNLEDPKEITYISETAGHILENEEFWKSVGLDAAVRRIKSVATKTIVEMFSGTVDRQDTWWLFRLAKLARYLELPEEIEEYLNKVYDHEMAEDAYKDKKRNLMRKMGKDWVEGLVSPQKARGLLKRHGGGELPKRGQTVSLGNDFELVNEDGKYYVRVSR